MNLEQSFLEDSWQMLAGLTTILQDSLDSLDLRIYSLVLHYYITPIAIQHQPYKGFVPVMLMKIA